MVDVTGKYAEVQYSTFSVGDKTAGFPLTISGFFEPNPYGLRDELSASNGAQFSTEDQDNSGGACSLRTSLFLDAPWW